jgi:hypothetical protein
LPPNLWPPFFFLGVHCGLHYICVRFQFLWTGQ